ncbi:MAG: glycosyltransferase family 9 protein [Acidobacteria bacterium]|nr:glycosyltransferase family 9 protein [Acidobacteriota bacterium]
MRAISPLLVDTPNWLGDLCHTLPAIERLLAAAGHEAVTLLVPPAQQPLARLLASHVVVRPPRAGFAWARRTLARFGVAVAARHSTRAKLLLAGVRADLRLASRGRGAALLGLATFPVDRARHQRHDLDAALARLELPPADDAPTRLPIPDELRRRGEARRRELTPAPRAVALFPASHGMPAKRWPAERFAAVGRAVAARGAGVLVVVGPGEEALGQAVAAATGSRLVAGELTLDEVAALLAACAVAVGNDSGLTHLAAVAGCPTVALFGPTDPARTAPVGGATILRPPTGRPLADLPADEVAAAVLRCQVRP